MKLWDYSSENQFSLHFIIKLALLHQIKQKRMKLMLEHYIVFLQKRTLFLFKDISHIYIYSLQMSESKHQKQTKPTYVWSNKQEYPNADIKQAVQKVLNYQDENNEHLNVLNLFDKIKNQSELTLLHLDDKTKQMKLYSLPIRKTQFQIQPEKIRLNMMFSNIRNRFSYMAGLQYRLGGQGPVGYVAALMNGDKKLFTLSYVKFLGERLDNFYKSTIDGIQFKCIWQKRKYWDSFWVRAARKSRQNYISLYDQNNKKPKLFGLLAPERDIPKHSNIYELSYKFSKNAYSLYGTLGYDFSNNSIFKYLSISTNKYINLGENAGLFMTFEASNLWGNNILKNDYIFKNKKTWIGTRTKNSVSPRFQIILKNYPFISSFKLNPYLYSQVWASFLKNEPNSVDTNFECQYGLGVQSDYYSFKFQVGLFQFSGERKANLFGNFKFNF